MEFIPAKTIVTRTKNAAWFGTDYNMNIYKGCCHGCIYCDSRSECYGVDEFDRVRIKKDAADIIERELRSKSKKGVIGTGAMSDPYNPFEKKYGLTRQALESMERYWFGVAIATKSDLIVRDVDVLQKIARHAPVLVKVTVTSADDALCERIEPHAPPSSKRFEAIRTLAAQGIFTGILMMPVLPFLEDSVENVTAIVERASANGARFVYPGMGVTLRQNQRDWFLKKLDMQFPGMRLKYEKRYGYSYQCSVRDAKTLWDAFTAACGRYGLLYRMGDIIWEYRKVYEQVQLSLF